MVDAGPGINVFDTRSPARIARITTGQGVAPKLLAFSHDGSMFLTSALRNAQVWRTRTGELLAAFAATDTIVGGTISGDGNEVLLDREGGTRESWGLRPDSASLTLQLSEDYDRLRFAADGGLFGAQSFGGATPEPLPWRPIVNPNGSNEPSVSVAKVPPDVHDRIVAALEALGETVVVLAPSPDGKQVASASQLAPSERIPTSSARGSELRVRSNGTGQIVRIWDAQTAQVVLELVGHSAQVKALAYSADGESLATLAEDREVRIFPASVPSFLARGRALLDEQERREAPSGNGTGPATRRTEP